MKKIILSLSFIGLLIGASSCSTNKVVLNREIETTNGNKILLGTQTISQFKKEPYSQWYSEKYDEYETDKEILKELKKRHLNRYKIRVFVGTWCGDSKREFPRLMKILDELNYPEKKLTIVGVNTKKESPDGEATHKVISRVPTIIVERYDKEIGRIIEMPETGYIEKDLLEILKKDDKGSAIIDIFNK